MHSKNKPVKIEEEFHAMPISETKFTCFQTVTIFTPLRRHTDKPCEGFKMCKQKAYRTFKTTLN